MKRLALVFAAVLLVGGCSNVNAKKKIAEDGVVRFHQQLDAGKFGDIYDTSAPEFKSSTSNKDWTELASAVERKLGHVKKSTEIGWRVFYTSDGAQVVLTFDTEFATGKGTESFTYFVREGKPQLFGYNIQSNELITK